MKNFIDNSPSLRRRLFLTLLLPLGAVLIAFGAGGIWFSSHFVEAASDRVLSGSLQAIAETLAVEKGQLTLNLPPSALGMLENADRDNVYYSISYKGRLVTGYGELSAFEPPNPRLEEVVFRGGTFRGEPIRLATEAKLVPQLDSPVIVQVAETMTNRTDEVGRIVVAIVAAELFLLLTVAALIFIGINWGLKPLARLQKEVELRGSGPEFDLSPLPLSTVPTEAKSFVSAFNGLLGQVEHSVETLRRFTSDASHQLRAPLAVIRTHIELLQRDPNIPDEERQTIDDIHNALKVLQRLIVQLIALAKAERPNIESEDVATFDLVECAASAARSHVSSALNAGIAIQFETELETCLARGNSIFAKEMISNLLDNAVRYGNAGDQVVVRVGPSVLEIEDQGPGIHQKEQELVFERFYRGSASASREGSGLGLSIVQALGKRMGAKISLHTPSTGKGLRAVIHFSPALEAATH